MRTLPRPAIDPAIFFDTCTSGITDPAVKQHFAQARQTILDFAQVYLQKAPASTLHEFLPCSHGESQQIIVGALTKGDLNGLYSNQMVKGPGRSVYDDLMTSVPLNKCPYCGLSQVATLDHVLSKSRYPVFSTLPDNLVPTCGECNHSKGGGVATVENTGLHPYFEPADLSTTSWLHATAQDTMPVVVSFFLDIPDVLPPPIRQKITNHFRDLELARRYSVEAASELASIQEVFRLLPGPAARHAYLQNLATAESRLNMNSWKAATYRALEDADWFWSA
ncbi:HNH endonuclease [Comamonas sediminis]|uniref:HNH endonuclease n=1 Tax=Comamonas sediminis TaxID=1783360 RepID=A0ABV4B1X3_9BURK